MPQVVLPILLTLITHWSYWQPCTMSGQLTWNRALLQVLPGCPLSSESPDRRLRVQVDEQGDIHVFSRDASLQGESPRPIDPPAMISWSPRSNAFFVNDGEGSGQSSVFRFFRIEGRRFREDPRFFGTAVREFLAERQCPKTHRDLSVWGFGWSPGGTEVFLLVQNGSHQPCGSPGEFLTLIVRTADHGIVSRLNEQQSKRRFRSQLPPELFIR